MTETFENDWTREIEKLRKDKAALLEALKSIVGRFGGSCQNILDIEAVRDARAAIAQAEKEGV